MSEEEVEQRRRGGKRRGGRGRRGEDERDEVGDVEQEQRKRSERCKGGRDEDKKAKRGRCIKRKKITPESGDGKEEPHDPEEEGGVDGRGR